MEKPKVEVGSWGDGRDPEAKRAALDHLDVVAWVLDSSIPIPGIGFRIGVDSLIGLIPIVGDAVGALVSSYILFVGARLGAPKVTLLRMALNVALEALVGMVPLLGDVFDMAWKANTRNVALLRAHVLDPARARRGGWIFFLGLLLGLLALLGLMGWGAYALIRAIA